MINKPFYSTTELAKISQKSRIAIFKKIKNGQIKAKKVGRNYAIPVSEVNKIVAAGIGLAPDKFIKEAVGRAVREYSETFKLLGKE